MVLLQKEKFGWSMWRRNHKGELEQFGAITVAELKHALWLEQMYISLVIRPGTTFTVRPLPLTA